MQYVLILITVTVAVIGTVLDKPSKVTKRTLVALAAVSGLLSVIQTWRDDTEKRFMKVAIISTLSPPNSQYQKIIDIVKSAATDGNFEGDKEARHTKDGLVVFMDGPNNAKKGVFLFDPGDIAQIFADLLDRDGDSAKKFVASSMKKDIDPSIPSEELYSHVAILEYLAFIEHFESEPDFPRYSAGEDVEMDYKLNGQRHKLVINRNDLVSIGTMPASTFYSELHNMILAKLNAD